MSFFKRVFSRKSPNEPPAEVTRVFDAIRVFLADEMAQNDMYPPEASRALLAGAAVDRLPNGSGEFGRHVSNPIPVNGFIGELLYISSLRTGGAQMIGHRLGSIGHVDVFELMSVDGAFWDLLYFDLYHPRKSRDLPDGYVRQETFFIFATNENVPTFPQAFRDAISLCTKGFLGVPFVAPELFDDARFAGRVRPLEHAAAVARLRLAARKPVS